MEDLVVDLVTAEPDSGALGGKGASLARLLRFGHEVPAGFVLTVQTFSQTLGHLGLDETWSALERSVEGGQPDLDLAERLRQELAGSCLPNPLADTVVSRAARLTSWGDRPGLIVRSSATMEDSERFSFAGIFESVAVAPPGDLESTILEVWASLLSARALAYVRDSGLRAMPSMAVVVQRLLDPQRSGVMFTRFGSPDGSIKTLIEHVEGSCEKLVKGEVTPSRLWLERSSRPSSDPDGLLGLSHLAELAELAVTLEEEFGGPQDVEWCIEDDVLYLVQTRPVTTGVQEVADLSGSGADPVLVGVGASRGIGQGPAHLVFNIDQALALHTGQVLVTPMTNPDMVVAMRNSAAIVTDVGGMICHAAIVSRELGLPCVVGTETATQTLTAAEMVTVDGSSGLVYSGTVELEDVDGSRRLAEAGDLWRAWTERLTGRGLVPLVSALGFLDAMPPGVADQAVVVPDVDLRCDLAGLGNDLQAMSETNRIEVFDQYLARLSSAIDAVPLDLLWLYPLDPTWASELEAGIRRGSDPRLRLYRNGPDAPVIFLDYPVSEPRPGSAVPLATALLSGEAPDPRRGLATVELAIEAAVGTIKFFGHRPAVRVGPMPEAASRVKWWRLLPEYGRYHQEFGTPADLAGEHEWLEVRPELVISALLKSLVQPGFEMVPRVMGFADLPPMHIKWIRCRYHFRADTFALVWESIARATWDRAYMADLLRRIRRSYDQLEEVLPLFPSDAEGCRSLSGREIVALITSWWPRWVEFFALCWFIQAQGDDVLYPFIEETVEANLAALDSVTEVAWFPATDLIAPTTPVMSAQYMADVGRLHHELLARDLRSADDAIDALSRGEHPVLERTMSDHLSRWRWMRDRDLLFEPWDTPRRVIETALQTGPHPEPPYRQNLERDLQALAFHVDLAHASGRAAAMLHAGRLIHDLNVERENHHILWLKYSYPLRLLFLEVERRLVDAGSLDPGDVFFLQAPELIEATRRLPAPLPEELARRVRNRRAGFLAEARLAEPEKRLEDEDDYY